MSRFLRLHPEDNVLVALGPVPAGTPLAAADAGAAAGTADAVRTRDDVALAHKIAARAIPRGAAVVKYGMTIGEASRDIPAGAHVHVHNVVSRYTPTIHRGDGAGGEDD